MKPFSTVENTMNGALVIPKLIYIKFCCIKDNQVSGKRRKKCGLQHAVSIGKGVEKTYDARYQPGVFRVR